MPATIAHGASATATRTTICPSEVSAPSESDHVLPIRAAKLVGILNDALEKVAA